MKSILKILLIAIVLQSCAWTPEQRAQFARGAAAVWSQPAQQPQYQNNNYGAAPLMRRAPANECDVYCQEIKRQQEQLRRKQEIQQYIRQLKNPYNY